MKDLGPLHHFLGVKVIQDQLAGVIWIDQPSYTEILQKFGMYDCKPVSTPVNPDVKLVSSESPDEVCDQQMYQAVIGNLLYLYTKTRPDIAYELCCSVLYQSHERTLDCCEEDFAIPEGHKQPWSALSREHPS